MAGDLSYLIPDNWLTRVVDAWMAIMLIVIRGAHKDFRDQEKSVRNIQTRQEVLETKLNGFMSDVTEVKDDVKEMRQDIKTLLGKHTGDAR